MKTLKSPRSLGLVCGLALGVLPAVYADHHGDSHFKKMDANNDGKVSVAEHTAAAKLMFTECDANHDGLVTAAEMDAAMVARGEKPAKDEKTSAEKIKMMDQNSDGKLTAAEHDAGTGKMFAKMDKDADGALSKAECDEAMKTMKKDK